MAKTTKTATSNGKSKNKITLNLAKLNLDDNEKLDLLRTVREAVSLKLKRKRKTQAKGLIRSTKEVNVLDSRPATLKVVVTDTEPGLSHIVAEHNGDKRQVDKGDSITFNNVKKGDLIEIEGDSLGTVKFTIEGRQAKPSQQTFAPMAIISFHFRILE